MLPGQMKKATIERLQSIPDDITISVCPHGAYSKADLIEHVKKGDEIGRKMVEIISEYLTFLSK